MMFSVTYYLELRNAISIYCISHILTTKGEIGISDCTKHSYFYLVKNYTNNQII
jgi:hypothetical protein